MSDILSSDGKVLNSKKIYLAILTSGDIRIGLAIWLNKLTQVYPHPLTLDFAYREPIQSNRNAIVQKFLATDCTHLIMIDADMVPPPDMLKLLDLDKDFISPLYMGWQNGALMPFAIRFKDEIGGEFEFVGGSGLQEVDLAPGGAMMIKRRVLEKIKRPFEVCYDDKGIALRSEDMEFSRKLKKAGFKMWVHMNYISSHFKKINTESVYSYLQQKLTDNKGR